MKLLTQKFVRSLSKDERKEMLKRSVEASKYHGKCHDMAFSLMKKQTGLSGETHLDTENKWINHPLHPELNHNIAMQYKHDCNTRLLRDL